MTPTILTGILPELAARIDQAGQIVLGLDFDGTLTPIQLRPDDVALAGPVRAALDRLATLKDVKLVVVSGRSLRDVAARVGIPGLIYAGNHGLEIHGPDMAFIEPTARALEKRLQEVTEALQQRLSAVPGSLVEAKGLTTSVHYRNVAPAHQGELADIVDWAIEPVKTQFVLSSGHAVWEIRPRVAWHKGDAMAWTLDRLGEPESRLTFFLGDDRTDEDAFSSLPGAVTVKVGSFDTPTRARYWLPDPDAVYRFLDWLEKRLTSR